QTLSSFYITEPIVRIEFLFKSACDSAPKLLTPRKLPTTSPTQRMFKYIPFLPTSTDWDNFGIDPLTISKLNDRMKYQINGWLKAGNIVRAYNNFIYHIAETRLGYIINVYYTPSKITVHSGFIFRIALTFIVENPITPNNFVVMFDDYIMEFNNG